MLFVHAVHLIRPFLVWPPGVQIADKTHIMAHVVAELAVTRSMLKDIGRREEELGKPIAAKDLENCLEVESRCLRQPRRAGTCQPIFL